MICSKHGMKCSKCNLFSCEACLIVIYNKIPKRYHDSWCIHVLNFFNTGQVSSEFIGHCCELSQFVMKKTPRPRTRIDTSSDHLIDGDLCLPEFNLLIKTSFKAIDILGLGGDDKNNKSHRGAWHCTIRIEDAERYLVENVHPQKWSLESTRIRIMRYSLPWSPQNLKYITVDIVIVPQLTVFDTKRKGSNLLRNDEISSMNRYCGEVTDDNIDATIIIGRFQADNVPDVLLLMRFHKFDISTEMNNRQSLLFYKELSELAGKEGYECRRVGGSSGTTEMSLDFRRFIHCPGSFPSKCVGIKFVKQQFQWKCLYIGSVRMLEYSNKIVNSKLPN